MNKTDNQEPIHAPTRVRPPPAGKVWDIVGNTPLVLIQSLSERTGCRIFGKAEFMNPGGSVKDRTGRERKQPHPGIEPQPTARSITIGPSEGANKAFSDVVASANRPSRRLFFHGVIWASRPARPPTPRACLAYAAQSPSTRSRPSPSSSGIGSAGNNSAGGPRIATMSAGSFHSSRCFRNRSTSARS